VPVIVEDAERANIRELMLASLLRRKLTSLGARAHAKAIAGRGRSIVTGPTSTRACATRARST
jgi:hypothetical protein